MPTLRPFVKRDDSYFMKIVKYIPAEIVAAYTFSIGIVNVVDCGDKDMFLFPWVFYILLVFTPIYMYFAVIDKPVIDNDQKKLAIFHAIISLLAYIIWAYALGDKPMICYINDISGKDLYNAKAGALLLALFTLIVPLLERIFMGKPKP